MSQSRHHGRGRQSRGRQSSVVEGDDPIGAGGSRRARLQHLLLRELAGILRDESSDPRLTAVRLSTLELSVDGSSARIGYVLLVQAGGEATPHQVAAALEGATGFFRARLADTLDLKRLPRLRFVLLGALDAAPGGELPEGEEGPWRE